MSVCCVHLWVWHSARAGSLLSTLPILTDTSDQERVSAAPSPSAQAVRGARLWPLSRLGAPRPAGGRETLSSRGGEKEEPPPPPPRPPRTRPSPTLHTLTHREIRECVFFAYLLAIASVAGTAVFAIHNMYAEKAAP